MIWARPLSRADSAAALWKRSGLTPEGVGLVQSGLESHALVTGLTALWVRGEELTCDTPNCEAFHGHYGGAPRIRHRCAACLRPQGLQG